jgi:hypothetical protein
MSEPHNNTQFNGDENESENLDRRRDAHGRLDRLCRVWCSEERVLRDRRVLRHRPALLLN